MLQLVSITKSLPPDARKELIDFAEFLKKKYSKKSKNTTLKLNWAGGLSELNDKFDAVNLQHNIRDLWSGSDVSC